MSEYFYEQADRIRMLVLRLTEDQAKNKDTIERDLAERDTINAIQQALNDVREIDRSRRFNAFLFPALITIALVFALGLFAGLAIGPHVVRKNTAPVEAEQGVTP